MHKPARKILCNFCCVIFKFKYKNTNLKEIDVRVNHGIAEMWLHIGHRLSFDLQTIPDPHVAVDLWQTCLQQHILTLGYRGATNLEATNQQHWPV